MIFVGAQIRHGHDPNPLNQAAFGLAASSRALEFSPLLCGQSDPRRTWARRNCWMQRLTMDSIP
jgi:hypothetical protein